jgi:hypothetical protein
MTSKLACKMTIYEPQPYDEKPLPADYWRQSPTTGDWMLVPIVPPYDKPVESSRVKTPGEWAEIYAERDVRFARLKVLESASADEVDADELW